VAYFSRLFKVVIDVPAGDYDGEVSFWAAALGEETARVHLDRP
jgi:hypothetical protein